MKNAAGDIIILHMCTKKPNHMIYHLCDMEWDRQKIVIMDRFLLFYSPLDTENQSFEEI